MNGLWRSTRWPLCAVVTTGALVGIAAVLDAAPPGTAHELALTVGAPGLVLLILAVLWLLGSLAGYARRRRRGS